MSPSPHRHLSPASAANNRRQLANVALATVLAFVIAGMVVVLARHSDRTLALGDVGVAVASTSPEVTSPVAGSATGAVSGSARASSPLASSVASRASAARSSASRAHGTPAGSTASTSSAIAGIATTRAHTTAPAAAGSHHASPSRTTAGSSPAHPTTHPSAHTSAAPSRPVSSPASSTHPVPPSSSATTHPAPPPPSPTTHSSSPTPPKPAASVSIAQGARVPSHECYARDCYYVAITLANFGAGTHTVSCSNSRDGTFATFTTTQTVEAQRCYVWHSRVQVWVTVDGVRSNTLDWNPGHHHHH